jgi:hypothetical protein
MTSLFFVLLLFAGLGYWFLFGTPPPRFLTDFAQLLDRSKMTGGLAGNGDKRWYLTGEFRGRKVVVTLQLKRTKLGRSYLFVSMQTKATVDVDAYEFPRFMHSKDAELALFALDAKHGFRLTHQAGELKALWLQAPFFFPGGFDSPTWQSVLDAMHAVAGSLEQRAA